MKCLIITIGLFGIASFGQTLPKIALKPKMQTDSATRSNFLAHTGGILKQKSQGPHIQIVNIQKSISFDVVEQTGVLIGNALRTEVSSQNSSAKETKEIISDNLKDQNIAALLLIVDDPQQPSMLVAPENRWAILNVSSLKTEKADVLNLRFKKQLWRTVGYLMGAVNAGSGKCVMKPILKSEDLDALEVSTLGLEAISKIQLNLGKYGIAPERIATYRKACEEGWAPIPTNNFQKAIWEEVKAKKPITHKPAVAK